MTCMVIVASIVFFKETIFKSEKIYGTRQVEVEFVGEAPKENTEKYRNLINEILAQCQLVVGQLDQALPVYNSISAAIEEVEGDNQQKLKVAMALLGSMGYENCRHVSPPAYLIAVSLNPGKEIFLVKGEVRGSAFSPEAHTWVEIEKELLDWYQFTREKDEYEYRWHQKFIFGLSEKGEIEKAKVKVNMKKPR